MNVLSWIFFGLVVGVIAKVLMPGKDAGGFIITILLGITGAMLAGWIISILGAIILLVIYRFFSKRATIACQGSMRDAFGPFLKFKRFC